MSPLGATAVARPRRARQPRISGGRRRLLRLLAAAQVLALVLIALKTLFLDFAHLFGRALLTWPVHVLYATAFAGPVGFVARRRTRRFALSICALAFLWTMALYSWPMPPLKAFVRDAQRIHVGMPADDAHRILSRWHRFGLLEGAVYGKRRDREWYRCDPQGWDLVYVEYAGDLVASVEIRLD